MRSAICGVCRIGGSDAQATGLSPGADADGLAIAADARLDNRSELARVLGVSDTHPGVDGDATILLAAYRRWGAACVDHLYGDYAFAVWDSRAQRLFCARDPFGVKPFFYYCDGGTLAFASEIKALVALDF